MTDSTTTDIEGYINTWVKDGGVPNPDDGKPPVKVVCIRRGRGALQGTLVWRDPIKTEIIIIDVLGKRYKGVEVSSDDYGEIVDTSN